MNLSGLGGGTQIRGYGCKPNVAQGPMLLVLGLEALVQCLVLFLAELSEALAVPLVAAQ